jgi:predicted transcriptional regulator
MAKKSPFKRFGNTIGGTVAGWGISTVLDPLLVAHGIPPLSAEIVGGATTFFGGLFGDALASLVPKQKPTERQRKTIPNDELLEHRFWYLYLRLRALWQMLNERRSPAITGFKLQGFTYAHDDWRSGQISSGEFEQNLSDASSVLHHAIVEHYTDPDFVRIIVGQLTDLDEIVYNALVDLGSGTMQEVLAQASKSAKNLEHSSVQAALDSLNSQGLVFVQTARRKSADDYERLVKTYLIPPVNASQSDNMAF